LQHLRVHITKFNEMNGLLLAWKTETINNLMSMWPVIFFMTGLVLLAGTTTLMIYFVLKAVPYKDQILKTYFLEWFHLHNTNT